MISRPLMLIHASLTLLIPLFLALMLSGCDVSLFGDKNKGQSVDYGPETSVQEIKDTFDQIFQEYDSSTLKVGEWVQQDVTQQLNGSQYLIEDVAQAVTAREEDDPVEIVYRVVENRRFFDSDGKVKKKVDTEFSIKGCKKPDCTPEAPADPALATSSSTDELFGDPKYRIEKELQELSSRDNTVTLHNLQVSSGMGAPPPTVANSPDCTSIFPNCEIKIYTVTYDRVYWTDGKGEKIHYEYRISPQAPYLGAVLSECLSGVFPVQDQHVYLKQCTTTNNFKFGTL